MQQARILHLGGDIGLELRCMLATRWRVVSCLDLESAAQAIRGDPFDLILAALPEGPDRAALFVQNLLAAFGGPRRPLFFLMHRGGSEDGVRALEAGADDCVGASASPREVAARIDARLRGRASEAAIGGGVDAAFLSQAEFLTNLTHELRAPLAAISGFGELLSVERLSPQKRRNFATRIVENSRLLSALINDVLDLSRIEAGKLVLERLPLCVAKVLADVESTFSTAAARKGIGLYIELADDAPRAIETDPTRLKQILLNLVGNAVKFTHQGQVVVRAYATNPSHLTFDVIDTGPGIAPEVSRTVFEPFVQGDVSTPRRHGGSGLGLGIARKLARILGGDLELAETQIGSGSTFRVTIAANTTAEVEGIPTVEHDRRERLRNIHVLVVDDDADMRVVATQLLCTEGASVDVAVDGDDAVQHALAEHFDVVLMDLQMPACDGFSAVSQLRRHGYDKPIVAVTAHAFRADRDRALAAGCDRVLTKPVQFDQLVEAVVALAGGAHHH